MATKPPSMSPTDALALIEQTRHNMPITLIASPHPQVLLTGMDQMGQGKVWRSEVPRVLETVLGHAGHPKHWQGNHERAFHASVVRAVMDPWTLTGAGPAIPARDDSHIHALARENPELAGRCYEMGVKHGAVEAVTAAWHLLSHVDRKVTDARFSLARDPRIVGEALSTMEMPGFIHTILKIEERIEPERLKKEGHILMRGATLVGQAMLAQHMGAQVAKRDPLLWNHLTNEAKRLAADPEVAERLKQRSERLRETGAQPALMSPEVRFVTAIRHVNHSLKLVP